MSSADGSPVSDLGEIIRRVNARLFALGLTAEAACLQARTPKAIAAMLRAYAMGDSVPGQAAVAALEALAPVLRTSRDWLLDGSGPDTVAVEAVQRDEPGSVPERPPPASRAPSAGRLGQAGTFPVRPGSLRDAAVCRKAAARVRVKHPNAAAALAHLADLAEHCPAYFPGHDAPPDRGFAHTGRAWMPPARTGGSAALACVEG